MGEPIRQVKIRTFDGKEGAVQAVFDTGAHPSIIREDRLPPGAIVTPAHPPQALKTAARGGTLRVTGIIDLTVELDDRMVLGHVLVCPDLGREMIVGAGLMQEWDITIENENGRTEVRIGKDLRDPDVQEVV